MLWRLRKTVAFPFSLGGLVIQNHHDNPLCGFRYPVHSFKTHMSDPQEIIEQITEMIVAAVKKGVLEWRRSWKSGNHANVISKERYGGANLLLLESHAAEHGLEPYPSGGEQEDEWKKLHCTVKPRPDNVKPEQWGCGIVVVLPVSGDINDPETGTEYKYISLGSRHR